MTQPNPEREPSQTMDTVAGPDTRNALGGEPQCVVASRYDEFGRVTMMHVHEGDIVCPLAQFVDLPGTLFWERPEPEPVDVVEEPEPPVDEEVKPTVLDRLLGR
jgi:hypothetical protein